MKENFISVYEFQETILKCICSDEINKIVESTVFKDDPNAKEAIKHGMVMAALITSKCTQYYMVKDEKEEETKNEYIIKNDVIDILKAYMDPEDMIQSVMNLKGIMVEEKEDR